MYLMAMLRRAEIDPADSRYPNNAIIKYDVALRPEQAIRQMPRESAMASETRPMIRTKAKESRYGGADRICEVRAEKAMLLMIVGKNTGSEAKETLIERNMSACSHAIELERVATVLEALMRAMMLPSG